MGESKPGGMLAGKTAVIAGDAYGIGRAAARLFHQHGAAVFWLDDSAGSKGDRAVVIDGIDVPFAHADVTDRASVSEAVSRCEEALDKVDILLNVAGRAVKQSFEHTTEETWQAMIARNLTSVFVCSQQLLPLMKKSGSGSIVNQGSIDSFLGNPSIAAYSAAKGGVIPLTHVMAHDLAKYAIRVNCISTGGIRAADAPISQIDQQRIAVTPMHRMGTAEDVARVALFLASDMSTYVNGANIVVDGGRTAITQGCYND
jgi:NAD(P)-dependent dehydrogenase (short-subunit alcohol dehydrogenase family)